MGLTLVSSAVKSVTATQVGPTTWQMAFGLAWRIYLPVRLLLSAVGAAVAGWTTAPPIERTLSAWLNWLLVMPWAQRDVLWYLKIVTQGYGVADGRAAFHPLLPLLMRLAGDGLGGQYLLAGLIVSNLACLVFLATLFRYVALDHGPDVATEATRWTLYAPLGFVLLVPYTEALLLCCTLLSLWWARHERWLAAGICAFLAALAKQPGAALVLPLLWEYMARHRGRLLRWQTLPALACAGMGPLGYLCFSLYRAAVLGDVSGSDPAALLGSMTVSGQLGATWGTRFAPPWEWLVYVVTTAPNNWPVGAVEVVLTLGLLALAAVALRRERGVILAYSLVQILLSTSMIIAGQPLQSLPRRLALVFPVFTQVALWTRTSRLRVGWLLLSLITSAALTVAFCTVHFTP